MMWVQQDGPRSHPCLMPGPLSPPPPPDMTMTMMTMMTKSMKEMKMRWRLWGPWRLCRPLRRSRHGWKILCFHLIQCIAKFYTILHNSQSSTKSFG
eukprot:scaffold13243_cov56-Attheya_sp.AAC.1